MYSYDNVINLPDISLLIDSDDNRPTLKKSLQEMYNDGKMDFVIKYDYDIHFGDYSYGDDNSHGSQTLNVHLVSTPKRTTPTNIKHIIDEQLTKSSNALLYFVTKAGSNDLNFKNLDNYEKISLTKHNNLSVAACNVICEKLNNMLQYESKTTTLVVSVNTNFLAKSSDSQITDFIVTMNMNDDTYAKMNIIFIEEIHQINEQSVIFGEVPSKTELFASKSAIWLVVVSAIAWWLTNIFSINTSSLSDYVLYGGLTLLFGVSAFLLTQYSMVLQLLAKTDYKNNYHFIGTIISLLGFASRYATLYMIYGLIVNIMEANTYYGDAVNLVDLTNIMLTNILTTPRIGLLLIALVAHYGQLTTSKPKPL